MYDVGHIAINADDVDATLAFYTSAWGWSFQTWGPPGFHRAEPPGGFIVAIQNALRL